MMQLDEYQRQSYKYAMPTARHVDYLVPGLAGEVGELCSLFAKGVRDSKGYVNEETLVKELGDVLWFVAGIASHFNIPLEEVAELNLHKLESRKQRNVISGSGDDR
jgi:NTP pyrophosphatase (non-canonical NTP hydrolase)